MLASAKQLIEAGNDGKWAKVSADEQAAVIDSIAGENLVRAGKGLPNLRHYVDRGYLVVCTTGMEAEKHPQDA